MAQREPTGRVRRPVPLVFFLDDEMAAKAIQICNEDKDYLNSIVEKAVARYDDVKRLRKENGG